MRNHAVGAALLGALFASCSTQAKPKAIAAAPVDASVPFRPIAIERIDTHTHIMPGSLAHALQFFAHAGITTIVNLSGGSPGHGLEQSIAEAKAAGHTIVFYNPDFKLAATPGGSAKLVAELEAAYRIGARGVKVHKGLGLGYTDKTGKLIAVDDKRLDALFEAAGRLGMPVAIHTGDPKAFWLPPTPNNERYDELSVHPQWSFYGYPVSWEELHQQFERRVARHPKTTFIGVHFGNDPEDPDLVAALLDRYPNLVIDTAARVPEIGRADKVDPAHMRALFEKYSDRILFGTDTGYGDDPPMLMLGSSGAEPPDASDVERFFTSTWRYFETNDRDIPSPTPIQGRWAVNGLGLPREILQKIYHDNAARVLHLQ